MLGTAFFLSLTLMWHEVGEFMPVLSWMTMDKNLFTTLISSNINETYLGFTGIHFICTDISTGQLTCPDFCSCDHFTSTVLKGVDSLRWKLWVNSHIASAVIHPVENFFDHPYYTERCNDLNSGLLTVFVHANL